MDIVVAMWSAPLSGGVDEMLSRVRGARLVVYLQVCYWKVEVEVEVGKCVAEAARKQVQIVICPGPVAPSCPSTSCACCAGKLCAFSRFPSRSARCPTSPRPNAETRLSLGGVNGHVQRRT